MGSVGWGLEPFEQGFDFVEREMERSSFSEKTPGGWSEKIETDGKRREIRDLDDHADARPADEKTEVFQLGDDLVGGGRGNFQIKGERADGREQIAGLQISISQGAMGGPDDLVRNGFAVLEMERKGEHLLCVMGVTVKLLHCNWLFWCSICC